MGIQIMGDYKTLGNWDSYLAMDKWIQSLLKYAEVHVGNK